MVLSEFIMAADQMSLAHMFMPRTSGISLSGYSLKAGGQQAIRNASSAP